MYKSLMDEITCIDHSRFFNNIQYAEVRSESKDTAIVICFAERKSSNWEVVWGEKKPPALSVVLKQKSSVTY